MAQARSVVRLNITALPPSQYQCEVSLGEQSTQDRETHAIAKATCNTFWPLNVDDIIEVTFGVSRAR